MKLFEHKQDIETVGDLQSTEFRIQFDEKMAHLLSTALYSDKISSLIRELSCNAADSHIAAGHHKPFDVTLPTRLQPNFILRDYGTGLTPDQVQDVYTVYGASDKTNSNKLTGCMGLGSKTPACYHTKSATIDSYVDGKHWSYSFHTGPNGVPCLTKLIEESTTEPNGVKITVPVAPIDFGNFLTKATEIYRWFRVRPNVTPQLNYPQTQLMLNKYPICDKTSVVMGNVRYPVTDWGLDKDLKILYNCNLLLEIPIGSVEPAVSREQLQYTDRTKATIIKKLREIYDDIVKTDLYKDCKTLHQARIKLLSSKLPPVLWPLFKFRNNEVDTYISRPRLLKIVESDTTSSCQYYYSQWKNYPIYRKDCYNAYQRLRQQGITAYVLVNDTDENISTLGLTNDDLLSAKALPNNPVKRVKQSGYAARKYDGRAWQQCRINDTDTLVYVTGETIPIRYYFSMQYSKLTKLNGGKHVDVYYVTTSVYEKIKDKTNFIPLEAKVKELIQLEVPKFEQIDKAKLKTNYSIWSKLISSRKSLPENHCRFLAQFDTQCPNYNSYAYDLALQLKLFQPKDYINEIKTYFNKYPLLSHLEHSTPIELISQYLGETK